ncbi:MAG: pilus assembly protein N-terminal domain-containing protein [Candidatus Eremiobacteraeota bacterium]|nr:pilus assembly protein N-terminal domain-containing protein [Candidatus Eremiobacteraeota bacterium]MBC5804218.1 pilus assembly protein N-terminal domain-containing protein [Candidatus Eremiobacteraeota bacterium]MBC5822291.1 pilus assembly protein N-terminal domain-containing protein [Candidatus Eremiobacteraeota bacterium]
MRRLGAPLIGLGALLLAFGSGAAWRAEPAPGASPTPSDAAATNLPTAQPETAASAVPSSLMPAGAAPQETPAAPEPSASGALPSASPTQPPIIVNPPSAGVTPGGTETLHVMHVLGAITATVADPTIVDATVDQGAQTVTLTGKALGTTLLTITDGRGLTRQVPVRVAYPAGDVPRAASVRITGDPATQLFVREQAVAAAVAAVSTRPGASVVAAADAVSVPRPLAVDDIMSVDVPLIVQGDGYFTVQGTTRVRVENFAQPRVPPGFLLVSDYPETLREDGILFSADLDAKRVERFLYYHYNPPGQPDRRIVLKVRNDSPEPALVQYVAGVAGPEANEMEVGHLSTQRFLVRRAQNEGTVVTIAAHTTTNLAEQPLPAGQTVSGLMQLHAIAGAPLHLTLLAQDASDSVGAAIPTSAQLVGDKPHARGIYTIPEFFYDYSYDTEGPDLEIPIGQFPLSNLVEGQTLAGDYGVLQSVTVRIVNNDRRHARQIALYASPRGGKATGTFIIDRVLVQAHAMAAFGHYKLRQYTIAPGSFVRTDIVTMPEGGSSYPLRLVMAPDDGSAPPGSSDSPVY